MNRYLTDRDVWEIDPKVKCLWASKQEREHLAAEVFKNSFCVDFSDLSYLDEGLEVLLGGGKDGMIADKPS